MRHPSSLVLFPGRGPWPQAEIDAKEEPEPAVEPRSSTSGTEGGRARRERVLLLHLPAFPLERCGYTAEQVAACVDELKGATRLVAVTPAAAAEGLEPGMTTAEARALFPDVLLEPRDLEGEQEDRQALVQAFSGFTDRIAVWNDTGLVLEVRGTAHLFGGEEGLLERVRERATDLGHACQLAITDDVLAAEALAIWGRGDVVVPAGKAAQALATLPLAALRPSPELAGSLEVLGLRRVEAWARLDPASVAGRFGAEGLRLHRIARGGVASRLPWARAEGGAVAERVVLGGPTITLEPVYFVLSGLVAQVCEELAARDAMAVRLAVHLLLERGPAHVVRVRVGRPTRAVARLEALIRTRLERVRLDAPAVELLIEVEEDTREQAWQPGLLDRGEAGEELLDLVARLGDALGEQAVFSPVPVESWLPEGAWTGRSFEPGAALPRPPVHRKADDDPVAEQRGLEEEGPRPRPTLLLPPSRIEVQQRGGCPRRIRLEGRWHDVQVCEGPERLEGHWWQEDGGFCRDYWVVQVEGRVGWCFHDERGRWCWHGWFD